MSDQKVLHDYCIGCKKTRIAKKEGPLNSDTGLPLYKTGDFIVDCTGITTNNKFIPQYDRVTKTLTPEEIDIAQGLYDPVIWAKQKLNWEPRKSREGLEYQKLVLRCDAKRKVLRQGRRTGKTEEMVISILHYLFTNSPKVQRWDKEREMWVDGFATVLVLTPYLSQVKLIFNRIRQLLEKNQELQNEVKKDVSTPFHCIELYNGVKVVGFSSGAKSGGGANTVRGQKADFIVLDEMDYLNEEDIDTVMALLMEHGDVRLLASSTPSGRREYFYNFCVNRMDFKEFYFKSDVNPAWGPKMEAELRETYNTEIAWQHEILAEFGEAATSVFQNKYVSDAQQDYRYADMLPQNGWSYSIGIDWNDTKNGTKLCVLGWDPKHSIFRVVDKTTVQKVGWTQISAVNELIRLNRKWKATFVYVDAGYGAMQIEVIKQYGLEAFHGKEEFSKVDSVLKDVVGINFSSKIETYDPVTSEPIKKLMKPFMVENAVRRFEQDQIKFSLYDEVLHKQLIGYQINKISAAGVPVYEAGLDGDHDLDALMLAMLAFQLEMSEFINPKYSTNITFSGRIGEPLSGANSNPALAGEQRELTPQTPHERTEYNNSSLYSLPAANHLGEGRRIYSVEAFNSDERGLKKRKSGLIKRGSQRTRRSSF